MWVGPPCPLHIAADRELLRQALFNLLQNAIEFSPSDSEIQIERHAGRDGCWALMVADRGPGVKGEHQALLFTPYFTTRPSGTGLGLAIVRRIASPTVGARHGSLDRVEGRSLRWRAYMAGMSKTILVVDDEPAQRELLSGFLARLGFHPVELETAERAIESIRQQRPDLVLLDVRLPGMNGIEALREIRVLDQKLPVLLITAHADIRQAVAAVKSGADDYLAKPVDLQELRAAILDALGSPTMRSCVPWWRCRVCPRTLSVSVTRCATCCRPWPSSAPSTAPVLITGESGTGKERIADLIHRWSPRADRPLVTANCGGLPETLIESELFGHTKGAFTGAVQARDGVFRVADGGTLFLDEIGELPLHLQPTLLRAVEAGEIRAVGSDQCTAVDVRLIAATHANMEQAIQEGRFREDLYYRINVIELRVPALRQRRDDILPLSPRVRFEFHGRSRSPLTPGHAMPARLSLARQRARAPQCAAACLSAVSRRCHYAGTLAAENRHADRRRARCRNR